MATFVGGKTPGVSCEGICKGIKSDKTVKKSFRLEHALTLPFISKVQITCVTNRKKVMELILFALNNLIE